MVAWDIGWGVRLAGYESEHPAVVEHPVGEILRWPNRFRHSGGGVVVNSRAGLGYGVVE